MKGGAAGGASRRRQLSCHLFVAKHNLERPPAIRELGDDIVVRLGQHLGLPDSLHHEAAFVLDLGRQLYVWTGSHSSVNERYLARLTMEQLEDARAGQAVAMNMPDDAFWRALGGAGDVAQRARDALAYTPPAALGGLPLGHGALFRLSAASGALSLDEVHRGSLRLDMLVDNDVLLCDPGAELIVWMGKGASDRERRAAMLTATKYLALQGKPHTTPIKVFKSMDDAMRDESFAQIFAGC